MNTLYKRTQTGWVMILTLFPIIVATSFMHRHLMSAQPIIPFLTIGVLIVCLVLFYNLTIEVDDEYVRFSFGIGLIRKKYKIDELEDCLAVKNVLLSGWGIRRIWNGWLYNVSGFKAIELRFKDKTDVVRIGTDAPDEVAEVINQKLRN